MERGIACEWISGQRPIIQDLKMLSEIHSE